MRDYLKGMTIIVVLFAALGVSIFASSRPDETLNYARATALSLYALPGGVTAAACRQLVRMRAIKIGRPVTVRS